MDMLCTPVSCRLFDVLIYFIIVIPMAYMQSHIHSAWSCPVFVDVSWRSDDTWSPPRQNPAKELMARASPSLPISWQNAEVLFNFTTSNTQGLTVRVVNNGIYLFIMLPL